MQPNSHLFFFALNMFFIGAFLSLACVAMDRELYFVVLCDCFFVLMNSLLALANGTIIYDRLKNNS